MLGGLRAGQILLADRAYDSDMLRQGLREQGAFANIKPLTRRCAKPAFSPFLYRYRNLVERFFSKLKHFVLSPPATTSTPPTTSLSSNSQPLASGCALMSRRPSHRSSSSCSRIAGI
jgi:transposase